MFIYDAKKVQTESNEVHFNCRGAAFLMQRKCKPRAMKFTSIAEMQPFLCKDTLFYENNNQNGSQLT